MVLETSYNTGLAQSASGSPFEILRVRKGKQGARLENRLCKYDHLHATNVILSSGTGSSTFVISFMLYIRV